MMENKKQETEKTPGNRQFLACIELLKEIDAQKLFPKQCRTCGATFESLSEYLCYTVPKGHSFDDCSDVFGRPYTMVYRHCKCSNTLVLSLTEETFPHLNLFWKKLNESAQNLNRPLKEVVEDFVQECDGYLLSRDNPCEGGSKKHSDNYSGE